MTTDTATPRTDALVEKHIGPVFNFRAQAVELHALAKTLERDLRECVELLEGWMPDSVDCESPDYAAFTRTRALIARLKEKS